MKPLHRIRLHLGALAAAALLAGPGTVSAQGTPIRIGLPAVAGGAATGVSPAVVSAGAPICMEASPRGERPHGGPLVDF